MSVARSVAEVLRDHVVLEVEAIDRIYLNVYVPHLQSVGAVMGYLRVHRGQRFASTTAVMPMTEAFVRNIAQVVDNEGVDVVAFQKGQRKDDVTQKYLRRFIKSEGVLYVGKAQEKARVMRTERRRSRFTGGTYPWIVESTAMVNHYYFYRVDEDFGSFFVKFCSYFPYNAKLCINGNEYLKRQLAKRGVAFEALDNGVKSCADLKLMQRLCDGLSMRLHGFLALATTSPSPASPVRHATIRPIRMSPTTNFARMEPNLHFGSPISATPTLSLGRRRS